MGKEGSPLKAGIVGCGGVFENHAISLEENSRAELETRQILGNIVSEGFDFLRSKIKSGGPTSHVYSGHKQLIDRFVESLLKGEEPPVPGEDGLEIVKLTRTIFDSARKGERLEV